MLKFLQLYSNLVLKFVGRNLYFIKTALFKVKHKQSWHRFHDPHPAVHNACLPTVVLITLPLLAIKTFLCLTQTFPWRGNRMSFSLINHKKNIIPVHRTWRWNSFFWTKHATSEFARIHCAVHLVWKNWGNVRKFSGKQSLSYWLITCYLK